jgi:hypothetical protein
MIFLKLLKKSLDFVTRKKEFTSRDYWEKRYLRGGNSGAGTCGELAKFKANYVNNTIDKFDIKNMCEWGCGDGKQASYFHQISYTGFDVSQTSLRICKNKFKEDTLKKFHHISEYNNGKFQLTISLDVIYHLIEEQVYDQYMKNLFSSSNKIVVIYSSNTNLHPLQPPPFPRHIKHRNFSKDLTRLGLESWKLVETVKNPYPFNGDSASTSFSDFYLFKDRDA